VVDSIGVQELYVNSAAYLREGGVYAAVGVKVSAWRFWPCVRAVIQMQLNAIWPVSAYLLGTGRLWKNVTMMDPGQKLMEKIIGMVSEGRLRVVVDRVLGFDDVPMGYEVLEAGHAKGKIIVKVDDDVD
jgi:reticulon-4-interacting protein 1, mitochondrial